MQATSLLISTIISVWRDGPASPGSLSAQRPPTPPRDHWKTLPCVLRHLPCVPGTCPPGLWCKVAVDVGGLPRPFPGPIEGNYCWIRSRNGGVSLHLLPEVLSSQRLHSSGHVPSGRPGNSACPEGISLCAPILFLDCLPPENSVQNLSWTRKTSRAKLACSSQVISPWARGLQSANPKCFSRLLP